MGKTQIVEEFNTTIERAKWDQTFTEVASDIAWAIYDKIEVEKEKDK